MTSRRHHEATRDHDCAVLGIEGSTGNEILAVAGESAEMKTMGGDRSDDEIDTLLSEGRMSGPTKDRVFEGALRDAGIEGAGAPRARAFVADAAGRHDRADAGGGRRGDDSRSSDFEAAAIRSAPREAPPRARAGRRVRRRGRGRLAGRLPQGATLVFSIRGDRPLGGYLAGYADPGPGGERIWYFSADGDTPALPASVRDATLPFSKAIRIGPEPRPANTGSPCS